MRQEKFGNTQTFNNRYRVEEMMCGLVERRENKEEILIRLDQFFEQYGIDNYSKLMREYIPEDESIRLVIATQVPTVNFYSICHQIFTKFAKSISNMKVVSAELSLNYDHFVQGNLVKEAYLRLPIINSSDPNKQGQIRSLADNMPITGFAGKSKLPFTDIVTDSGTTLVEFHRDLRVKAGFEGEVIDLSDFFADLLRVHVKNINKAVRTIPEGTVFIQSDEGKMVKVNMGTIYENPEYLLDRKVRLGADIYYNLMPIYLALFAFGDFVLMENLDGCEMEALGLEGLSRLSSMGIKPLIQQVPYKELKHNRALIQENQVSYEALPVAFIEEENLIDMTVSILNNQYTAGHQNIYELFELALEISASIYTRLDEIIAYEP